MPATCITDPVSGATVGQIWKPLGTPGVASDATAPFALGQTNQGLVSNVPKTFQFVRASAVVAAGATAGVSAGVFGAAAGAGNTWTNPAAVATVIGDYLFVYTGAVTTP